MVRIVDAQIETAPLRPPDSANQEQLAFHPWCHQVFEPLR
jgi:hypothetical protein